MPGIWPRRRWSKEESIRFFSLPGATSIRSWMDGTNWGQIWSAPGTSRRRFLWRRLGAGRPGGRGRLGYCWSGIHQRPHPGGKRRLANSPLLLIAGVVGLQACEKLDLQDMVQLPAIMPMVKKAFNRPPSGSDPGIRGYGVPDLHNRVRFIWSFRWM